MSSVAIQTAGATEQDGETKESERVYGEGKCIINVIPLLIPVVDQSKVAKKKGETEVKGKRQTYTSPSCFSF